MKPYAIKSSYSLGKDAHGRRVEIDIRRHSGARVFDIRVIAADQRDETRTVTDLSDQNMAALAAVIGAVTGSES